ncbi:NAD(P)/FAD-dependent oxidoreductase [Catenulispora yoronensis]|uniref:NAD(P)/FAD-dependent oxidoreductase n=1 Tax=Catenulispora yoronensis TaxID=450799 RepID=A0ABP5H756_9ACTN
MAPHHDAIIVGAGFGGLGAAIQFRRLGLRNLAILERGDGVGGVWRANRYPGVAVDIPSANYSFSFEPNPYWSRLYAPGTEILRYAEHVTDKYGLRGSLSCGTTVDSARWMPAAEHWSVRLQDGRELTARFLVTATGSLSQPKRPDIPGLDDFAGPVLHTAYWDDGHDLDGRRVAVIGTGASAVQAVPEIARRARTVTVFQRTPVWVLPRVDVPIPRAAARLFALLPATHQAARLANAAAMEFITVVGGQHYRRAPWANKAVELLGRAHLRAQVPDAETRSALTPGYTFGCKRPTASNAYLAAFAQPRVRLVTEAIEQVERDGVRVADGTLVEADVLVLATGFDVWDQNFPAFRVEGRDGRDLGQWWRTTRFQAYQGLSIPGFPNFLSMTSPYSYTGLCYFWTVESQMRHMARLFGELRRRGAETFEVREEADAEFGERMREAAHGSIYGQAGCAAVNGYYFSPHGDPAIARPSSAWRGLRENASFPLGDYAFC